MRTTDYLTAEEREEEKARRERPNTCSTCRFWLSGLDFYAEAANKGDGNTGMCRRFPPVAIATSPADDDNERSLDRSFWGEPCDYYAFPVTLHGMWCGEFKPRLAVVPNA